MSKAHGEAKKTQVFLARGWRLSAIIRDRKAQAGLGDAVGKF